MVTQSLPAPLELTKTARDVSVTEGGQFRTCRRRWLIETIDNWTPKSPQWALEFGTGIHSALEEYYRIVGGMKSPKRPMDAVHKVFEKWYKEIEAQQAQLLGPLFTDEARDELWELRNLGQTMLANYAEFSSDEAEKDPWEVIAVEGISMDGKVVTAEALGAKADLPYTHEDTLPFIREGRVIVPIVDPATGECLEGRPFLSGRIDLIVRRGKNKLWIVDHKTTGSSPSDRGIDFEDQITGYSYIVWRLTGVLPRGTIFNYLVKQVPKEPRIVGVTDKKPDGELSSAKDQLCLARDYREEMIARDIMVKGSIASEKHAECYSSLLAKGWDPYFKRFEVQRNEHEITSFELRLASMYEDMHEAFERPDEKAYPNPSSWHCPGCSVAPICQAMEDGSDVAGIIESRYMQAPDRKAER